MSRKKHQEHHEEHADESWLIPYADILTLLLALFIVLFSSAQVDSKKLEQIKASFIAAFGVGTNSIMPDYRATPSPVMTSGELSPNQRMDSVVPSEGKDQLYVRETAQLLEVKRALDQYIQQNALTGDLNTMLTGDGLMLRIRDSALFPSGSAELLPESKRLGTEVAKLLTTVPQKVTISGHTDSVPIQTAEFPSNWELSSKRALNFMRFLLAQQPKLDPARFNATGHGEYHPVAPNTSEDGKAKNRRVEVMILRQHKQ